MRIELNMNDEVNLILTKTGAKIYNEYFKGLPQNKYGFGDQLRMPIWEVMLVFGQHLFLGIPEVCFIDNKLWISK
jgi:hypothetical protein